MSFVFVKKSAFLICAAALPATLTGQAVHRAQCDGGPSIRTALQAARPGDTVRIGGNCRESLVVTIDRLTIEGEEGALIQGEGGEPRVGAPLIDIRGAQGVVIRNLTVQDSPGEGIQVIAGSSVLMERVTLRRNTVGVIAYVASSARLKDVNAVENFVGIIATGNSAIQLTGEIRANTNQFNGFDINGNSSVELIDARVEANRNGNRGITLDDSELLLGGGPTSGTSFTADGNARTGILISGNSSMGLFGAPGGDTITVSNNREHGIWLNGGKIISPSGVNIVATGNAIGIGFELGSAANIVGGLSVRNNGIGIDGDGAGMIRVEMPTSGPFPPSAITGNTRLDLDLSFGSRMRVVGPVMIGSVACDRTVLTDGVSCP